MEGVIRYSKWWLQTTNFGHLSATKGPEFGLHGSCLITLGESFL